MQQAQLREYRLKLIAERARVSDLIAQAELAGQTVELDQTRVGRLSRMDAMQGQAMAKAAAGRQGNTLKAIDDALKRLEQGDYGRCFACDEWIAPARLDIDLTATHCITCAQAAEQR